MLSTTAGLLLATMDMPACDLLRHKGMPYDELRLDDPLLTEEELIDAIMEHPILINHPTVATDKGVRRCRPSEVALEILDNRDVGTFTQEDGETLVPRKDNNAGDE